MSHQKINVGFIGAGAFISCTHLQSVHESEIMNVYAIADIDPKRLHEHQNKISGGYLTGDYRKILDDPKVDIVIIGTKQELHAKLIIESLDAGKWVLCEKPMANTEDETKAVMEAEKRNKGKLAIGFNRRFAPAYRDAKKMMKNVKRPWFISYRLMSYDIKKNTPGNYYAKEPRILYEGCHILDFANWFFESSPQSVYMTGDRFVNNVCVLEYPDGSQLSFLCGSFTSPLMWKEYMEIFGFSTAITVKDFVDMSVRGVEGEFDRVYPLFRKEHSDDIQKYGFDSYEYLRSHKIFSSMEDESEQIKCQNAGISLEKVKRPGCASFKKLEIEKNMDFFSGDKGWRKSVEHFCERFIDGKALETADALAGAQSTNLALSLLTSLEQRRVVKLDEFCCVKDSV